MPSEPPADLASEKIHTAAVRRHIIDTDLPFDDILDGICTGSSRPDIPVLFTSLTASTTYDEFTALVKQAQGSAGRRLIHIITGDPVTMGKMTRHVGAAGSYAPVTPLSPAQQESLHELLRALLPYDA